MAAVISLGVLVICLQGKYKIEGTPGYCEPLSLYTVVIAAVTAKLAEYKFIRGKLRTTELEGQNIALRSKLHSYEDTISRNRLWSYFSK